MTNERDMKLIEAALEAARSAAEFIANEDNCTYCSEAQRVVAAIRAIDPAEILAKVGDAWQPIETAPVRADQLSNCVSCGKHTSGRCWVDCGMSLCGQPLCGSCRHVDEQFGWSHQPMDHSHD